MIKPVYESMAKDHPEVSFGKVDVDDNAEAAAKYEVRLLCTSMPPST